MNLRIFPHSLNIGWVPFLLLILLAARAPKAQKNFHFPLKPHTWYLSCLSDVHTAHSLCMAVCVRNTERGIQPHLSWEEIEQPLPRLCKGNGLHPALHRSPPTEADVCPPGKICLDSMARPLDRQQVESRGEKQKRELEPHYCHHLQACWPHTSLMGVKGETHHPLLISRALGLDAALQCPVPAPQASVNSTNDLTWYLGRLWGAGSTFPGPAPIFNLFAIISGIGFHYTEKGLQCYWGCQEPEIITG